MISIPRIRLRPLPPLSAPSCYHCSSDWNGSVSDRQAAIHHDAAHRGIQVDLHAYHSTVAIAQLCCYHYLDCWSIWHLVVLQLP